MPPRGLLVVAGAVAGALALGLGPGPAAHAADPAAGTAPVAPPPAADGAAYEAALRAGDAAFVGRDDPERLAAALARYREAAALRPGDPSALLAVARAEAFHAQAAPAIARDAWREASRAAEGALRRTSPAFAAAVDRGDEPGRAAAAVGAPGAEPLYWLALATMGMAQARGMAAVLAVKAHAAAMMERVAALDEALDHGGPRRALGAWLATIPSAAGGGAAAARRQFERARALAPDYQLGRVLEAQTLAVLLQDRPRFEALLREALAWDEAAAPAIAAENRLAKRRARELLAQVERLF